MNEFKGTKGRWRINHWSKGDSGVRCVKIDKKGISEYTGDAVDQSIFGIRSKIDPLYHNVQGSFEGAHICDVVAFSDESKANAQLISKAPEMLEMLKTAVNRIENLLILADFLTLEQRQNYNKDIEQLIKEATTI